MQITVQKPTEAERALMETMDTWSCGVSKFDWYYDMEETCLLIEGQVTVTHAGGSASFGAGDLVTFPKGLQCVWDVAKPVKKYYLFK